MHAALGAVAILLDAESHVHLDERGDEARQLLDALAGEGLQGGGHLDVTAGEMDLHGVQVSVRKARQRDAALRVATTGVCDRWRMECAAPRGTWPRCGGRFSGPRPRAA